MRILIDDKVIDALSISSATPSALYPADNLRHQIIARRYQGYSTADIVTITFSADQDINCFFYSLNNFTSFSVVLKDSGGSTLTTINVTSISNTGREYFSTVSGVRSMELNMSTSSGSVYLGIFRAGLYYQTRNFLNAYKLKLIDKSLYRKTAVGYTTNHHITPIRAYDLNFREAKKDEADEINTKYLSNGKKPVFFDLTHSNSEYIAPLYGNILQPPDPAKSNRRYAFQLKIEEAK